MIKNILCICAFCIVCFSCQNTASKAQLKTPNPSEDFVKVDSFLSKLDQEKSFMGSVAFSKNGNTIYTKAIGYQNLKEGTKAHSSTKYRIGSISKTFTATLVFMAIEENKIKLDQTIESFFPEIPNANSITISHLLHHQSGIESYTKDNYFWENRTKEQTSNQLMDVILRLKSNFNPGEETQYSNSNYFLLSQLLENIYQDSYEHLLVNKIFNPLKLDNTYVGKKIQSENEESFSYSFEDDKYVIFPETHLSLAKGSGSLVSTPADLNIFFRSLLKNQLISSESVDQMTTIVNNHGMGIFKYSLHDHSGFGHGGNIDEFAAQAIYFEDTDLAVSITSNASVIHLKEVYSQILELYLDQPELSISTEELEKYVGVYTSEEDPSDKAVFERNEHTLVSVVMGEYRQDLIYKGERRFLFNQMYAESISFHFSEDGSELIFEQGKYKGKYVKK